MRENSGLESVKQKILPILQSHGVTKAGIFVSFARGEARGSSDIDVLVELEDDLSLLDFVGIKLELEEALGRKIDLVEYDMIKPSLRERILDEQVVIL